MVVLAPSAFQHDWSRDSLRPVERIRRLPYGAPTRCPRLGGSLFSAIRVDHDRSHAARPERSRPHLVAPASSAMDSLRLQWDRLFVHFSAHDQFTVGRGIRRAGRPCAWGSPETMSALAAQGAALLVRVVTALTPDGIPIMPSRSCWRSARCQSASCWYDSTGRNSATKQFLSSAADRHHASTPTWCTVARNRGIVNDQHHAAGFLHHIRERWSEAWPMIDSVARLYARVRFGRQHRQQREIATAENDLRRLRTLSRPAKPTPNHHANPACGHMTQRFAQQKG